eukprot:6192655-Pleurochrysis_carterae.AAC.2
MCGIGAFLWVCMLLMRMCVCESQLECEDERMCGMQELVTRTRTIRTTENTRTRKPTAASSSVNYEGLGENTNP